MKQNNPISIFIIDKEELTALALKHEIGKAFNTHTIFISVFIDVAQCEAAMRSKPDIVVIDHRQNTVSKKDGRDITFIDRLKSNSQTQVIMLTAQENAEVAVQALHLGVHDYIVKNEFMFKKLRLSLIQCFTILELRRNMKKQLSLGIVTLVIVFLMFGVAVSLRTLAPASLMIR